MADPIQLSPTRWWQVRGSDGKVTHETTSEEDARLALRQGDTLWRFYKQEIFEWRQEE